MHSSPLPSLVLSFVLLAATTPAGAGGPEAAELVAAARTVADADPFPTLVTIGPDGRPRARTVEASAIEETATGGYRVWIATNPDSRKVAQLRARPAATVHWADDDGGRYTSLMGRATLHDDRATIEAHTFNAPASLEAFWPDWPEGYLLIRVDAERIEVLGAGLDADPATWAPAGADLTP